MMIGVFMNTAFGQSLKLTNKGGSPTQDSLIYGGHLEEHQLKQKSFKDINQNSLSVLELLSTISNNTPQYSRPVRLQNIRQSATKHHAYKAGKGIVFSCLHCS